MKASLKPGLSRTNRIVIDQGRTIAFMGEDGRVYATPCLVRDVEYTCRDLLLEHVDAGEDSVGMEVSMKHLAPTLPGMTVAITVTIAAVNGRQVNFEVVARDDLDEIGRGAHARFVVDVAKTKERLKAKAVRRQNRPV